jgi:hypothetical protein
VRLFSLSILSDKIVLVVQSCRVPTPPSTGLLLVSVYCDQPPLICFSVCGREATTKPNHFSEKLCCYEHLCVFAKILAQRDVVILPANHIMIAWL